MYIVRFIILSTREIHNINKERETLINRRYRSGLSVLRSGTADPILSYFLLLRKNEKEIKKNELTNISVICQSLEISFHVLIS